MKKMVDAMSKIKLIRMCINIEKEKSEFVKYYKNSFNIRQVMKNDHKFMAQIKDCLGETYDYLNMVLREQEAEEFDFIIQQELINQQI